MAFRFADDVLRQGIQGIVELVTKPGMINVDFAHVRSMMHKGGGALMAIGLGEGANKAEIAMYQALHHPLLEDSTIDQASGALVHFTGGEDLGLVEVGAAIDGLREGLPAESDVVLGVTSEPAMQGRVQVILVITGIGGSPVQTLPYATEADAPVEVDFEVPEEGDVEFDNLDIPAFLRRRGATKVAVAKQHGNGTVSN